MEVRVLLLWGRCGLRLLPVGGLKSGGDGREEEVREESGVSGEKLGGELCCCSDERKRRERGGSLGVMPAENYTSPQKREN